MFIRRLLAFSIDVLPITLFCAAFFWFFQGFDVVYSQFVNFPNDYEAKKSFYEQRNIIRDLSTILCIVYFVIFEGSNIKNSIGKALLGVRVVHTDGEPLTFRTSAKRNVVKFVALLPAGLGFLYPLFNKERLFYHDKVAGTRVRRIAQGESS
ncbi:RDD family protein [Spongorhabdus nitratireducens]